mgnify:CR=1 FL=1
MAVIQSKRRSVIKKGFNYSYDASSFNKEHRVDNFYEAKDASEILNNIKPFEIGGRKFVVFDTESYPTVLSNHEIPDGMVRRWVGSGKSAKPQDFPFCISICDGTNAYTLHDSIDTKYSEMRKLRDIFEDPSIEKIAHNWKFDAHMFANINMKLRGKMHDTVVLAKLVNENRPSFMLRDLVKKIPGNIVKFEYMLDAYKKTHKIADYRMFPRELINNYANADVWNCYLLFAEEFPKLAEYGLEKLYDNEMELMIALWAAERIGIRVDLEYEPKIKAELQTLTDSAEESIYKEAGKIFNVNSSKQLYEVLMDLGVSDRLIPRTDKGNPQTNKFVLGDLANKHKVPIAQKILDYRKYEKLLTTYAIGIYDQRSAAGRVHGNINQTEATTGRMSITKPALQTLPKRDTSIRSAFIPSDGYDLFMMDLDQIEYRLFAHYSKAAGLIEAIKKGQDVHKATGSIIYRVPYDEVTDEQRSKAKTVNLSLIYGQGTQATADSLGVDVGEAIRFKEQYFASIPEAKPFIDSVQRVARTRGYIVNYYGRRRRLKTDEVYKAPNALIQGCAADYIKHKMVRIYKFLKLNNYKTRMLLVVHDEIVFEVHKDEQHFILPQLRWLLSEYDDFRVPITAGVEKGNPSWGTKEDFSSVGFAPFSKDELNLIDQYDVFNFPTII